MKNLAICNFRRSIYSGEASAMLKLSLCNTSLVVEVIFGLKYIVVVVVVGSGGGGDGGTTTITTCSDNSRGEFEGCARLKRYDSIKRIGCFSYTGSIQYWVCPRKKKSVPYEKHDRKI